MKELPDILYRDCDIVQGDTRTEFFGLCALCYRYEICKNAYLKDHMDEIFIVTYWDLDEEPVATVFNNQENAEKCYQAFKEQHDVCCIAKVPIYKVPIYSIFNSN